MKGIFVLGFVAAAFASSVLNITNPDTILTRSGGISPRMYFVANVDGKSFFADRSSSRNWTAAAASCKEYGLSLASITSANQFRTLNSAVQANFPGAYYWISGRDAQELGQYRWNHTNAALSATYLTFRKRIMDYQTCVEYFKNGTSSYLTFDKCDRTNHGILCET